MPLIARSSLALVIALALAPNTVFAADVAAANQLFDEAKALLEANKISEACGKFEASFDADPQLGSLMNLADCLERDGRVASAYGRWADAIEFALRKGDDRVEFARDRQEAIAPLLSFVTVKAVGSGPDLIVYKGNSKLSAGAFGSALPSNPGETVIQVVRGEDVLWETKIVLQEREQKTVDVPLGEIAAQNPVTVRKRTDVGENRMAGASQTEGFWSKLRVAGFAVGGVGILGLGAGFTLGGVAMSKGSDIDAQCTDLVGETRYCTDSGKALVDDARTLAQASTWTLVGSGIVTTVGITLIIAAPNDYQKLEERAQILPWFSNDAAGASVRGSF